MPNRRKIWFSFFFLCFFISTNTWSVSFFEETDKYFSLINFFFKKQKYIIFLAAFLPFINFLKQKRFFISVIFFLFQIFIIIYWKNLIIYFESLAGDSLSEINTFNISYIIAWLKSFFFYYLKPNLTIENFFKFYLIGFVFLFILNKLFYNKDKIKYFYFPLALFIIFVVFFKIVNLDHLLKNINTQKSVKKNFIYSNEKYSINSETDLVIFIAESTTSIMFENNIKKIINYVYDKNLGKLVSLQNVYSSHTHSTPSLLRAFSIPHNLEIKNLLSPITKRQSNSIFDYIDDSVYKTYISTTGTEGYNNLHFNVFFKSFNEKIFIDNNEFKYEKNFFIDELRKIKKKKNNLIVFHSQVGHAPYSQNIPENYIDISKLDRKDKYIKYLGGDYSFFKDIPLYDANLEYTSDILINIIKNLDHSRSQALIFFSDHGESVFTGSGHDSSRFVHEMLRVPLFIYFNNKFLEENNYDFESINNKNSIKTLDIVPEIVFEIYGLKNYFTKTFNKMYNKYNKLIFKREVGDNVTLIDLNYNKIDLPKNYKLFNDYDTQLHVLANNLDQDRICYHAGNTIARIIRGLSITKCIEFDLVIENDNFYIYHPPNKNLGLTLDELIIEAENAKSLWIDAKNLNEFNCKKFTDKIIIHKNNFSLLVEFPPETNITNKEINNCLRILKNNNIQTSYYVSNVSIEECLDFLSNKNNICMDLISKLNFIDIENNFTDISFDYNFNKIAEFFNFTPRNLKLNTWHIDYENVKKIDFNLFNLIIPNSSDFNRIENN